MTAGLRALLAAHAPADATEARHLDAVLRLLDAPGDPASRRRFDPGHLTASAFVVRHEAEGRRDDPARADPSVLMIHHARLGRWLQPGGHVEAEDAGPLEAAVREVAEETGIVVAPAAGALLDVDVHVIPAGRGEPEHLHFDLRWLFEAPGVGHTKEPGDAASPETDDVLRAGDGVTDVAWWAVDRLAGSDEAGLRRVAAKLGGRPGRDGPVGPGAA